MWRLSNLLQLGPRVATRIAQNGVGGSAASQSSTEQKRKEKDEKKQEFPKQEPGPPGFSLEDIGLFGAGAVFGHGLLQYCHHDDNNKKCLGPKLLAPSLRQSVLPDAPLIQSLNNAKQLEEASSRSEKDVVGELKAAEAQFERTMAEYETRLENLIGVDMMQRGLWTEGLKHFQAAADGGDPRGLYNAGVCNQKGLGTTKSLSRALEHWKRAADAGHGEACYNVGICYIQGIGGVTEDVEVGLDYMLRAMKAKVPQALKFKGDIVVTAAKSEIVKCQVPQNVPQPSQEHWKTTFAI